MRLFIAITLPQEVKNQLAAYARDICAPAARAQITEQDNFHLTLAFLGDALPEAEACIALDRLRGARFKLYSDQPGCFKRAGGDILWLALKKSPELAALHIELSTVLVESGFQPENRPFTPHITLARAVRGLPATLPPPRFIAPVNGLTLMNSERIDGLLTYRPVYKKFF